MKTIYTIFELLFGADELFIKSKTNKHEVTEVRFLFIYVLCDIYHMRPIDVMRELGYASHANIYHALRSIENWRQNNKEIQRKIDLLDLMFK